MTGYDMLASGLAFDFRGEPFGSTPDLALLAEDRCMWMTAYCTKCGSRAAYPQRIINGSPAPYNSPQIQVGGDETYEPRCDEHFVLPGRPLPGYDDLQRRIWPDCRNYFGGERNFDQSRTWPGRRSSPCIIQPGYSGVRRLTASISFRSASSSFTSTDARLSFN